MAVSFMVVSLPRCGTTWASNWLTTQSQICFHDPMWKIFYEQWDGELQAQGRPVGVACTGVAHWPEWLNLHPARKVVLHRPLAEINASLARIGLPALNPRIEELLHQVHGLHVSWTSLFRSAPAETIWRHLVEEPFDETRHSQLRDIEMQPRFAGLSVGPEVTRRLAVEVRKALGGA